VDKFTEAMILKKVHDTEKAILSFDTLAQTFKSEREFKDFCRKHNIRYSFGRECIILRRRERRKH